MDWEVPRGEEAWTMCVSSSQEESYFEREAAGAAAGGRDVELILLLRQVRLENVCMLLRRTPLTMPEKVGMARRKTVVSRQGGLPRPIHTSGAELEEACDPRPPGPGLSSQPTAPQRHREQAARVTPSCSVLRRKMSVGCRG